MSDKIRRAATRQPFIRTNYAALDRVEREYARVGEVHGVVQETRQDLYIDFCEALHVRRAQLAYADPEAFGRVVAAQVVRDVVTPQWIDSASTLMLAGLHAFWIDLGTPVLAALEGVCHMVKLPSGGTVAFDVHTLGRAALPELELIDPALIEKRLANVIMRIVVAYVWAWHHGPGSEGP